MEKLVTEIAKFAEEFFNSTLPEQILLWAGKCTEGFVNIVRNFIEIFG